MAKKSISIDFEYDYDFLLIGICSPLKEYQLCYQLNKLFQLQLQRSREDIEMTYPDGREIANFPLYEYWDTQYENQWYLLANKTTLLCAETANNQGTIFAELQQDRKKTKRLIPENSTVDFYIQIHGIFGREAKKQLIAEVKNIDRIVSIHEVNINKLRSKENLII